MGIPTLSEKLYVTAKDIFGRDCLAATIGYKRQGDEGYWESYVCIVGHDSIFERGATPTESFEAAIRALNVNSVQNLEVILGCKLVA